MIPPQLIFQGTRTYTPSTAPLWISPWRYDDGGLFLSLYREEETYVLMCDRLGSFHISLDGKTITLYWDSSCPLCEYLSYLSAAVCSLAYELQGAVVLHASCVVYNEKCILFCGASGSGKSTTALRFVEAGGLLVADDISVLWYHEQEDQYYCFPSPARLRLFDDVFENFCHTLNSLPLRCYGKLQVSAKQPSKSCLISEIVLLSSHTAGEANAEDTSLIGLLKHLYLGPLCAVLGSEERNFCQLANLVRTMPVKQLYSYEVIVPKLVEEQDVFAISV